MTRMYSALHLGSGSLNSWAGIHLTKLFPPSPLLSIHNMHCEIADKQQCSCCTGGVSSRVSQKPTHNLTIASSLCELRPLAFSSPSANEGYWQSCSLNCGVVWEEIVLLCSPLASPTQEMFLGDLPLNSGFRSFSDFGEEHVFKNNICTPYYQQFCQFLTVEYTWKKTPTFTAQCVEPPQPGSSIYNVLNFKSCCRSCIYLYKPKGHSYEADMVQFQQYWLENVVSNSYLRAISMR